MTGKCLKILQKCLSKEEDLSSEVVVVDNASKDNTLITLKNIEQLFNEQKIGLTVVHNSQNLGYSKANNKGASISKGKYLLFLNSDVLIEDISFKNLLAQLQNDSKLAGLTVKVVLPDGNLDPASHRGFPTIWRSFSYFSGLEKIFGKIPGLNRLFGGYHLTSRSLKNIHEIDSPTGAFYLIKRDVFEEVGGFDEDFFMYGEDIDLSYRIKSLGYKIIYTPSYKVTHLKYQSGLQSEDRQTKSKTKQHFYDAMKIFYRKHYERKTPKIITNIIFSVINKKAGTA